MEQLSNKIQIPIKTKIAAWWIIPVSFFTVAWIIINSAFANAPAEGVNLTFAILVICFAVLCFLCVFGLLRGKKFAWFAVALASLSISSWFFYMFCQFAIASYSFYPELVVAIYDGSSFLAGFVINFIPFLLLILDRKNYFAAIDRVKNQAINN